MATPEQIDKTANALESFLTVKMLMLFHSAGNDAAQALYAMTEGEESEKVQMNCIEQIGQIYHERLSPEFFTSLMDLYWEAWDKSILRLKERYENEHTTEESSATGQDPSIA